MEDIDPTNYILKLYDLNNSCNGSRAIYDLLIKSFRSTPLGFKMYNKDERQTIYNLVKELPDISQRILIIYCQSVLKQLFDLSQSIKSTSYINEESFPTLPNSTPYSYKRPTSTIPKAMYETPYEELFPGLPQAEVSVLNIK